MKYFVLNRNIHLEPVWHSWRSFKPEYMTPCLQSVYLHKFTLAPLICKLVVFPLSNSFIKLIGSILRFIFIFMLLTFFFGTAKTHQCSRLVSCAVLPLNGSVFSFSGVQFKPADGISTFLVYCFVLCFVTAWLRRWNKDSKIFFCDFLIRKECVCWSLLASTL